MAPREENNPQTGFYTTLGLASNASSCAIRNAYRKLAMKWHPDKCCSEDSIDAKLKFQEIQEAYTVLSDSRKKTLYDNGLYDPNDNEQDIEGLSCFMHELSGLMSEVGKNEKKEERGKGKGNSLEELQQLFLDIFGTSSQMAAMSHTNMYPSVTMQFTNKRNRRGEGSSAVFNDSEACMRTTKSPINGHVYLNDLFDTNSNASKKKKS